MKTNTVVTYQVLDKFGQSVPVPETTAFRVTRKVARAFKNYCNTANKYCAPFRIAKVTVTK